MYATPYATRNNNTPEEYVSAAQLKRSTPALGGGVKAENWHAHNPAAAPLLLSSTPASTATAAAAAGAVVCARSSRRRRRLCGSAWSCIVQPRPLPLPPSPVPGSCSSCCSRSAQRTRAAAGIGPRQHLCQLHLCAALSSSDPCPPLFSSICFCLPDKAPSGRHLSRRVGRAE